MDRVVAYRFDGDAVTKLLASRGMSVRALARAVGLHHSHVARAITGEHSVSLKALTDTAEALGVTPKKIGVEIVKKERRVTSK